MMHRVIGSMNQLRKEVDLIKVLMEEITLLVELGRRTFESLNESPLELPICCKFSQIKLMKDK